jgi:hypothetical protein
MAMFKNSRFYSIKEAVKYSTGEFGVIAVYIDKQGKEYFFINGRPAMSW